MINLRGKFNKAQETQAYILSGHGTITIRSKKTGARFTYKMGQSDNGQVTFIKLLNGKDNEEDFCYLGHIFTDSNNFCHGRKSRITEEASGAKAFNFTWNMLTSGQMLDGIEIWHEGRCGKCGRKLTVPESIERGIGPHCAKGKA